MADSKSLRNTVLLIMGVGLLFPYALPLVTAVAGFVAGAGMIAHLMGWRYAFNNLKNPGQERTKATKHASSKQMNYDRVRGWNVKSFPLDMEPHIPSANASSIQVKAAGIDNLVTASHRRGVVTFSFPLSSSEKAMHLSSLIEKSGMPAVVDRHGNDHFVVRSNDVDVINVLAKRAFPQKSLHVEHELTENRQYVIKGCKSYEEALQKFQETKDSLTPDNTYCTLRQKAEGMNEEVITNGSAIDGSVFTLPTGAYVVTESTVSGRSSLVQIPGDIEAPEAIRAFADGVMMDMAFSEGITTTSDGTPKQKAEESKTVKKQNTTVHPIDSLQEKLSPEPGKSEYIAYRITPEDVAAGCVPNGVKVGVNRDGERFISHSGGINVIVPKEGLMLVKQIGKDNFSGYSPKVFNDLFHINANGTVSRNVVATTTMKPGLNLKGPKI